MGGLIQLVPIVCLFVGFYFGYTDYEEWTDGKKARLETQITELEVELDRVGAEVRKGEQFKAERDQKFAELQALTVKLKEYAKFIPIEGANVANLIRSVADISDRTGVDISSVRPQQHRNQIELIEIPIEMNIKGNYLQIMSFLDFVSKISRIVTAEKIDLKTQSNNQNGVVTAALTLTAYKLGDLTGTPPPDDGK